MQWSKKLVFQKKKFFKINLQEHLSSCMYQKSHCNHCKQFVILHEHENCCPEMPVPCSLCSKVMKRKRLKVSTVFFAYSVHTISNKIFIRLFVCFKFLVRTKEIRFSRRKQYLFKWRLNSWWRCFSGSQILVSRFAWNFLHFWILVAFLPKLSLFLGKSSTSAMDAVPSFL